MEIFGESDILFTKINYIYVFFFVEMLKLSYFGMRDVNQCR